jgi:hypothetical protein
MSTEYKFMALGLDPAACTPAVRLCPDTGKTCLSGKSRTSTFGLVTENHLTPTVGR